MTGPVLPEISPPIRPEDESFHSRSASPYWNESGWFSFMIPERRIDGWVYMYHRPNMGLSAGGVAAWDPENGEQTYDCLFYDFNQHQPLPDGADMFDFTLTNTLSVKKIEALRAYQFAYNAGGCELDLIWRSAADPIPLETSNSAVGPWATNGYYSQIGRMAGTVTFEGERLMVDCWSMRDHSWGVRQPRDIARADYPWAIASESSAFQLIAVSPVPMGEDLGDESAEQVLCGWYTRDGETARLVAGERRVVERGEDGRPLHVVIDAWDALDRPLRAEGRCHNVLRWHAYPDLFLWWSLTEWNFDGNTAWGEEGEYCRLQQARRTFRKHRDRLVRAGGGANPL